MPQLIPLKEAAQLTGYSYRYLQNLCRKQILPAKVIGNRYFIHPDSLTDFMANIESRPDKRYGPKPDKQKSSAHPSD